MADKVTLSMIAKECNLSVGTVSRALNNKSDISAETKELVSRTARELGYCKSSEGEFSQLRIAMVYCRERADFYREVTDGILKAQSEVRNRGIVLDLLQTEHLNQAEQVELLSGLDPGLYDGLLVNSAGVQTKNLINRFIERGLPTATFNTDSPSSRRLFFVGCNAHICGQMGAHLLGKLAGGKGKVILFGSILGKAVWADRLSSAYSVLDQEFPDIEIVPLYHALNNPEDGGRVLRKYLDENPDVSGIFPINNARSCDVIDCLRTLGRRDISVVGFDLTKETRNGVLDGFCDAVLYQDPFQQGYNSVMSMVKYLSCGMIPAVGETDIKPDIVMKYNIDFY